MSALDVNEGPRPGGLLLLEVIMFDPDRRWLDREDRACYGTDPELFFAHPSNEEATEQAKELCESCPILEECRRDTLGEPYGIWGGLDPGERRLRRKSLAQKARKWPTQERLRWGKIAHELHRTRAYWAYVQERTGLTTHLAQKLAEEYRASLNKPREEPQAPPEGASVLRAEFPLEHGKKHAWIRRQGLVRDAFYRGQTADGRHFNVAVSLSKGAHSNVWIPVDDIRIYNPQPVEIMVKPRERRRYTGKRAA
jgi:WhiB family redox-sensing transcriptional regulator